VTFWQKDIDEKSARKMLMKLTPAESNSESKVFNFSRMLETCR